MEVDVTYFNEVFEQGGAIREAYRPFSEAMERIGAEELSRREAWADEKLRELGATFPLPGDPAGKERILPADWVPGSSRGTTGRGSLPGSCRGDGPSTPSLPTSTTASRTWCRRR